MTFMLIDIMNRCVFIIVRSGAESCLVRIDHLSVYRGSRASRKVTFAAVVDDCVDGEEGGKHEEEPETSLVVSFKKRKETHQIKTPSPTTALLKPHAFPHLSSEL